MQFQKTVDIWALTKDQTAALLPGQWVSAGPADSTRSNVGRFYGVCPRSGHIYCAWIGGRHGFAQRCAIQARRGREARSRS